MTAKSSQIAAGNAVTSRTTGLADLPITGLRGIAQSANRKSRNHKSLGACTKPPWTKGQLAEGAPLFDTGPATISIGQAVDSFLGFWDYLTAAERPWGKFRLFFVRFMGSLILFTSCRYTRSEADRMRGITVFHLAFPSMVAFKARRSAA